MVDWDDEDETRSEIDPAGRVQTEDVGPRHAYLVVLAGTGVGQVYKLGDHPLTIGRSAEADIALADEGLSRLHARVAFHDQDVGLEDLGSRNGTFLNGVRVTAEHPARLADGDRIVVGRTTVLKFTYQDGLEQSFSAKMYEAALKDGLTGLYNKKHFFERLEAEFSFTQRHDVSVALLFLDLDHFKQVNDTHGHLVGDQVLQQFAQRINATVRVEDLVARYGGEEFVILARGLDEAQSLQFAERLRELVGRRPMALRDLKLKITTSVGVAIHRPGVFATAQDLVQAADQALYESKRTGRNRVTLWKERAGAAR